MCIKLAASTVHNIQYIWNIIKMNIKSVKGQTFMQLWVHKVLDTPLFPFVCGKF